LISIARAVTLDCVDVRRHQRKCLALAVALAVLCPASASAEPLTAPEISRSFGLALESRFNLDCSQRIRLTTRSDSGAESIRVVELALRQIDGRLHAFAEIVEPEHLRGTRVLSIEAPSRNDDQFIFIPSHARVRRISGAQRADLFFGTDVTLEDFERHSPDDFTIADEGENTLRGEGVRMIAARPIFDSNYDVALFMIASDGMTLEVRYFTDNKPAPQRIVRAYRSTDPLWSAPTVPGRLEIENYRRGTVTEVAFELVVPRPAPKSLFKTDALESARSVPYLATGR